MDKLIAEFPDNILEGLKIAKASTIKPLEGELHEILICGMGGSGIGGKIVALWLQDEMPVPVMSLQDYNLPAYVDEHTLVIASSYSGNTEETLMAVEKAAEKGARVIGVTSGGKLERFCAEHSFDYIVVPGGNPPRSAIAFSLIQLTAVFTKLGLVSDHYLAEIEKSRTLILEKAEEIEKEARELALFINGRTAIFYASARYEGIAVRSRQQINENAKLLCWHHVIPEMNHNELVGWGGGDDRFAPVFFDTKDLIARNERRFEITLDVVRTKTPHVFILEAKGSTVIERSIYLIHLVDWASFFLAEGMGTDPIDIKVIDYLKDELSKL